MQFLRQASGTGGGSGPTISIGPCLDASGAEYTGLVIGDLTLTKNGTSAAMAANATLTHTSNGHYDLVMIGNNVDTLGRLRIRCNKAGYQIPPEKFTVLTDVTFDTLVANGTLASTTFGRTMVVDSDGIAQVNATVSEWAGSAITQVQSGLATAAAVAAVQTSANSILARIGAFAGTGLNTILGFLRAMAAKAAALTPSELSSGTTFDNTTDSLEALRDNMATAAAGVTITPVFSTVSAGEVVSSDITAYRNEVKPFVFILTDDGTEDGNPIDETGDILTLVISDLHGTTLHEVSGTVGGTNGNQITITLDATHTGTPGTYGYALWNETEQEVRAQAAFTVKLVGAYTP